eukprot:scaffold660846_cov74-Prasinocladus_malaysianus.AAC.1
MDFILGGGRRADYVQERIVLRILTSHGDSEAVRNHLTPDRGGSWVTSYAENFVGLQLVLTNARQLSEVANKYNHRLRLV